MKTWIVVANATQVKIFVVHFAKFLQGHESLSLIQEHKHPESRQHDSEIVSDKLGNYHGLHEGHGSFVESSDPHQHEAVVFATTIARILETARISHAYEQIILVAPPHFYGLINKALHANLKKDIARVIEKDYIQENIQDIEKHLRQQIG